jgi:NAD-dependent DNA ligase
LASDTVTIGWFTTIHKIYAGISFEFLSDKEQFATERNMSGLRAIPGIGPARAARLIKGARSIERVSGLAMTDLAAIPGIGSAIAGNVFRFFHDAEYRREMIRRFEKRIEKGLVDF